MVQLHAIGNALTKSLAQVTWMIAMFPSKVVAPRHVQHHVQHHVLVLVQRHAVHLVVRLAVQLVALLANHVACQRQSAVHAIHGYANQRVISI